MRLFLFTVSLSILMASCNAASYVPKAQVNIRASAIMQGKVIEASKEFGKRNGFDVVASEDISRHGRVVSQVDLRRSDGVMITIDNFSDADVLQTFFFVKDERAEWRDVKHAWVREVRDILDGQGEVEEINDQR